MTASCTVLPTFTHHSSAHGASAVISLKTSLYARSFPSVPVNSLRLTVTYHKDNMLQFKVCVDSICIKFLLRTFLVSLFFACQDHRTMQSVCFSKLAIENCRVLGTHFHSFVLHPFGAGIKQGKYVLIFQMGF